MFYLLVILGLVSMAAGVFVVGFGVPIRETVFGSGLLIAGSVAVTGGFIIVGLAAAVAELQTVVQALKARVPAVPRPLRPVDRKDGTEKRPGPPRIPTPVPAPTRNGSDSPHPIQDGAPHPELPPGPPPVEREDASPPPPRKPGPEWLRRAMAEIEANPDPETPAPERYRGDERHAPDERQRAAVAPELPPPEPRAPEPRAPTPTQNIFDSVWPSERRRGAEIVPEKRIEPAAPAPLPLPEPPPPRVREARPAPAPPPPPAPVAPPPPPPRPPAILKSGVIDEMAYTLFTDGSIEAQMPDGTMRFASIDELRRHLEEHDG
jgi:hypothetical protein